MEGGKVPLKFNDMIKRKETLVSIRGNDSQKSIVIYIFRVVLP